MTDHIHIISPNGNIIDIFTVTEFVETITKEIEFPNDPLPNNIPCRTRLSSKHEYTGYGDCHTARPKG